jgi:predicted ATPase/DNA-binding winged helix-turn-helix (wHTH) protein
LHQNKRLVQIIHTLYLPYLNPQQISAKVIFVDSMPYDLYSIETAKLVFGPFCLMPSKRLLTRDGQPVDIGGRALDLLIALVEHPGSVLSKRELMKRVWPDIIVEEGSVRFHMACLRKLLGDGENGARYISTQVGVGYAFVFPVERISGDDELSSFTASANTTHMRGAPSIGSLPSRSYLIGRHRDLQLIIGRLAEAKIFTIVGAGGIGKTSLAVDIGHQTLGRPFENVRFVCLAQIESPSLVPYAIAGALGIAIQADDPIYVLIAHIRSQNLLLIIDNCEHVIGAVTDIVERINNNAPKTTILATSREPLRVRGEYVHWLNPLDIPSRSGGLTVDDLITFPSVALFIERASAANAALTLREDDVHIIADMCRRLEGMALPIELAAIRAAKHGLAATCALLGERFSLEWSGLRTAVPRQQTLRATLDWSFDLLTDTERLTFARLSIFVGPFSIDAASHVVADAKIDAVTALARLDDLVAKGLVTLDRSDAMAAHRLLEMTRAYAKEKFLALGDAEVQGLAFRHAAFYLRLLTNIGSSPEEIYENASKLASQLGNIRSALEWSFGPRGIADIAILLAATSAQVFLHFSLMVECQSWCERAIKLLNYKHTDSATELELQASLGLVLMFTRGNSQSAERALRRALDIAVQTGDYWNQLRILGRLQIFYERIGNFETSLSWADQAVLVSSRIQEPEAIAVAASLAGISQHLLGNQPIARTELEKSLRNSLPSERSRTIYYGFDHRNRSCIALARTLWLLGYPDQARQRVTQAVSEAAGLNHPVTQCIAIIWTISVYVWTGEISKASAALESFEKLAEANVLRPYIAASIGFKGVIALLRRDVDCAVRCMTDSVAQLKSMHYELLTTSFYISLSEGLMLSHRYADAIGTINIAIECCEKNGDAFALPELFRIKASILNSMVGADLYEVEALLMQSLALSQSQGSRAWGLRAVMDLAELWLRQGKTRGAREIIQEHVHDVQEGLDTMDIQRLNKLIQSIDVAGGLLSSECQQTTV